MKTVSPPESHQSRRIMGVWDLSLSPLNLGGILILAEELHILRVIHGIAACDLCVVGDSGGERSAGSDPAGMLQGLLDDSKGVSRYSKAGLPILGETSRFYSFPTPADYSDFLSSNDASYLTWPSTDRREACQPRYGSTLFVQEFFAERGFIPHLSAGPKAVQWAVQFLEERVGQGVGVAVHLKHNPRVAGCSNANMQAWGVFLAACVDRRDVTFLLVGDDVIDPAIRSLPNVIVTRDHDGNIGRDLALIQKSRMFMGMASGPSIMAVFNGSPYVIFKNPDHDVEDMVRELGDRQHFSFAAPFQKVLREFETPEGLMREFRDLCDRTAVAENIS